MKKTVKLTEQNLNYVIHRVLTEMDEKNSTGKYYTLGGFYFFVNEGKMYLAEKSEGQLSPSMLIEFPSTKEISAQWTQQTEEVDDPNIKGKELKFLGYDKKMQNAIEYGKKIYSENQAIVNFGSMNPILFYSQRYEAPTLGGFIVGTDYPDAVEGKINVIDGKPGNKIFFQQSVFKSGKEYGIALEVSMFGQPVKVEDFTDVPKMFKEGKTFNISDFFSENSATPKYLDRASFLQDIRDFIKNGGKINKITIEASASKMPAGNVDNDESKGKWKDITKYDDIVLGTNDDGTGNLQLSKAKAYNTYDTLKRSIPELANAPYVLKASQPGGNYVHVKFE